MRIVNRKAPHNFAILEKFEAGIVLLGAEIKSIRQSRMSLNEGFVKIRDGEVWLVNAHINPWMGARIDPTRSRKLLLHKSQIKNLSGKVGQKGLTIVPLACYFKNNVAKLEIALARSKKKYEKREALKKKDILRETERELRGKDE